MTNQDKVLVACITTANTSNDFERDVFRIRFSPKDLKKKRALARFHLEICKLVQPERANEFHIGMFKQRPVPNRPLTIDTRACNSILKQGLPEWSKAHVIWNVRIISTL